MNDLHLQASLTVEALRLCHIVARKLRLRRPLGHEHERFIIGSHYPMDANEKQNDQQTSKTFPHRQILFFVIQRHTLGRIELLCLLFFLFLLLFQVSLVALFDLVALSLIQLLGLIFGIPIDS